MTPSVKSVGFFAGIIIRLYVISGSYRSKLIFRASELFQVYSNGIRSAPLPIQLLGRGEGGDGGWGGEGRGLWLESGRI